MKQVQRRMRIKRRIRKKISGTAEKPRLSVFRSNRYIYAQLIDDRAGETLASVSSRDLNLSGNKTEQATEVGKALANKAKDSGIEHVVFDRNGFRFHGRVKALADGARQEGLKF